jgi:hypothetical protein
MKKNNILAVASLVAFTGIYAQEDQKKASTSYFENFKDALVASDEVVNRELLETQSQEKNTFRRDPDQLIKYSKKTTIPE